MGDRITLRHIAKIKILIGIYQLRKRTIYTELLECLWETDSTLLEFAHENIYRDHSIGNPILGKKENINGVTRQMIVDYHDLNYTGENLLFVVSGNISHE